MELVFEAMCLLAPSFHNLLQDTWASGNETDNIISKCTKLKRRINVWKKKEEIGDWKKQMEDIKVKIYNLQMGPVSKQKLMEERQL